MISLRVALFLLIAVAIANVGNAQKIYKACELYRELRNKHGVPANQLATFVCIAYHESRFRTWLTSKQNRNGSHDHGLFQINDGLWCSPPGTGKGCGVSCAQVKTDDITKAVACARRIVAQTQKFRKSGFMAWSTYKFCDTPAKVNSYIKGC